MIEAHVNLTLVERLVVGLRNPDLRPAWKLARAPLRADIRDHRRTKSGPGGAWTPRAASTKARNAYGGRPRALLGKLPTALQTMSDRRRVAMQSRVDWSEIHKSGGTAGHGSRIPARDFLWVSQDTLDVVAVIVSAHLQKLANKVS